MQEELNKPGLDRTSFFLEVNKDWFENREIIYYTDLEGMKEFDKLIKEQLTKEDLNYKERKMEDNTTIYKATNESLASNTQDYNINASYNCNLFNDFGTYVPYQQYYYHTYPLYEDKTKKSFELVKKLMEKGLIQEPKTIKEFIELVTDISNLL